MCLVIILSRLRHEIGACLPSGCHVSRSIRAALYDIMIDNSWSTCRHGAIINLVNRELGVTFGTHFTTPNHIYSVFAFPQMKSKIIILERYLFKVWVSLWGEGCFPLIEIENVKIGCTNPRSFSETFH